MGKKGSKRKTRWRTLSIGVKHWSYAMTQNNAQSSPSTGVQDIYHPAPPGEEDEEDGLRNGYAKDHQENDGSAHSFERNGQGGFKPRRTGSGGGSSYGAVANRSHKEEAAGSPSQPKIIFNEDEYTRITTPRQDMLFKKGYLSRKKPWAGNASTSATPSTTESQSASHSTADGSETTEDQQLLDRDCGTGEYPPVVDSGAQLGYGTFYDHASGYYYEYPVMLVGPAPVPAQVGPSVLAAVPCEPVPLRPIEWINPAFVPKLAGQPYCMMDYQTNQNAEGAPLAEEQENTVLHAENTNGTCNESGTGSASGSGSVAGETEEQLPETGTVKENQAEDLPAEEQTEEQYVDEQYVEEHHHLENGVNGGPYLEPVLMQPPVHMSHVIPAVPQPYMYPGHYMFGPPLVNVNGVTIQGGPMIRITDMAAMSAACAKRRKKKKRRKQRRLGVGNTEDEEEGEYSSECDTGLPSSRLSWTACSTSTTTTTTISNRPLNPECQEFQLRPLEPNTSLSVIPTPASEESSAMSQPSTLSSDKASVDENKEPCNGVASDDAKSQEEESTVNLVAGLQTEKGPTLEAKDSVNEVKRSTNCLDREDTPLVNNVAEVTTIETAANPETKKPRDKVNGIEKEAFVNGKIDFDTIDAQVIPSRPSSRSGTERPRGGSAAPQTDSMEDADETLSNSKASNGAPKRKYSAKGTKFVREPTPGPDLNTTAAELENDKSAVPRQEGVPEPKPEANRCANTENQTDRSEDVRNHLDRDDPVEASNEDSGFESQTRLSDYPITEAVTEWLRKANSPDLFITSPAARNGEGTEDEDEEDEEPPKNLQGNPILALSANGGADDAPSCGEFARVGNVAKGGGQEQLEGGNAGGSRKRRDAKKKPRRAKHVDGRTENEAVSSSDSCGQPMNATVTRKKNSSRQPDVGDVCDIAEKDSVAGMRVASSSRMDSKRVNARRTKRQGRSGARTRRGGNDDEGIVEDTVNVRTFEKGEVVVSEDGKLITSAPIQTIRKGEATTTKTEEGGSTDEEEENGSEEISLDSIEEPDVLECWEAEMIEPVITPKKMQCRGVSCEGEAAEEDNNETERINLDYVQRYYRLARESVTSSIDEEVGGPKAHVDPIASKPVPKNPEQPDEIYTRKGEKSDVPVDEAFEVYESCYTGKAPFLPMDSKVFKSRTLFGQDGEQQIPCRAICCTLQ